jgi:hypothetical protein
VHELLPKRRRRALAFSVADDRHRPIVDARKNPEPRGSYARLS